MPVVSITNGIPHNIFCYRTFLCSLPSDPNTSGASRWWCCEVCDCWQLLVYYVWCIKRNCELCLVRCNGQRGQLLWTCRSRVYTWSFLTRVVVRIYNMALVVLRQSTLESYYYPCYHFYAEYLHYIPETKHVCRVYSVAAVLYLQSVLHIMLLRAWNMFCTFTLALSVVCVLCQIWLFFFSSFIIIILIITIIIISFMQGIYTCIPETNYVPREYSVAAALLLLFMVLISLVSVLNLLYFYISTFRSMCAVPNMAGFFFVVP